VNLVAERMERDNQIWKLIDPVTKPRSRSPAEATARAIERFRLGGRHGRTRITPSG